MAVESVTVLALDPSLRNTGYVIATVTKDTVTYSSCGVITTEPKKQNKGKSTSMPKLPTETECPLPSTTTTTKTATTPTTATTATTTKTTVPTADQQPSPTALQTTTGGIVGEGIDQSIKPERITAPTITRCPICRREIVVTSAGPCCKLWAKAYIGKRRPNPTAEVPNPVRQQLRRTVAKRQL